MHAPPVDLATERLRRLRQHDSDVFELGFVRMPQWITGDGPDPYRAWFSVAGSAATHLVGMGSLERRYQDLRPLDALCSLAERELGYRPAAVVVRDPALAEALLGPLEALGIRISVVDHLPVIDEMAAAMLQKFAGQAGIPGYLDVPGVSVDRVRAFAGAAADFHRSALWNHLADYDLIRIESPAVEAESSHLVILGGGGVEHGLSFFSSPEDHAEFSDPPRASAPALKVPRWVLLFEALWDIPLGDAELWETHALASDGKDGFPLLSRMARGRVPERPDAERLVFIEGLLRALAGTTEDELDAGRWQKSVRTCDGERTYILELPGVLDPAPAREGRMDRRSMERMIADLGRAVKERGLENTDEINEYLATVEGKVPHPSATTPRERADDKYNEALDARGRRRIKLAREALALWSDCADAWTLLAEDMPDAQRARDLWQRALDAAERVLGPDAFREDVGHFWGVLETRPYMRAHAGLADALWTMGERDAAVDHWSDMLRLNPSDNQGIRMILIPRLLEAGRDDRVAEVLEQHADERSATLEFARALLAFRREGPSMAANSALSRATRANPYALKYLAGGSAPRIERTGYYRPGDESEAGMIADELGPAYAAAPGAQAWLREHRRDKKKVRQGKKKGR